MIPRLISTVFGIGYAPVAPGTMGSLVAACIWWMWRPAEPLQWAVAAAAAAIGIWSCSELVKQESVKDPSKADIDEFAGMWIALAGLPHTAVAAVSAFLVFRALDISNNSPFRHVMFSPSPGSASRR